MLAALEDPNEVLNGVTIRDVYNYVMEKYAMISQAKVGANLDTFNNPIYNSRTLAIYIRKQELCQEMAVDTNAPIIEATMVTTGTKHAVATGCMDDVWRGWMRIPNNQNIWVRWKAVWGGAFL